MMEDIGWQHVPIRNRKCDSTTSTPNHAGSTRHNRFTPLANLQLHEKLDRVLCSYRGNFIEMSDPKGVFRKEKVKVPIIELKASGTIILYQDIHGNFTFKDLPTGVSYSFKGAPSRKLEFIPSSDQDKYYLASASEAELVVWIISFSKGVFHHYEIYKSRQYITCIALCPTQRCIAYGNQTRLDVSCIVVKLCVFYFGRFGGRKVVLEEREGWNLWKSLAWNPKPGSNTLAVGSDRGIDIYKTERSQEEKPEKILTIVCGGDVVTSLAWGKNLAAGTSSGVYIFDDGFHPVATLTQSNPIRSLKFTEKGLLFHELQASGEHTALLMTDDRYWLKKFLFLSRQGRVREKSATERNRDSKSPWKQIETPSDRPRIDVMLFVMQQLEYNTSGKSKGLLEEHFINYLMPYLGFHAS